MAGEGRQVDQGEFSMGKSAEMIPRRGERLHALRHDSSVGFPGAFVLGGRALTDLPDGVPTLACGLLEGVLAQFVIEVL